MTNFIIREIVKTVQKRRLLNFFKKYKKVSFVKMEEDDCRTTIYVTSLTDLDTIEEFRELVLQIVNDCTIVKDYRLPYVTTEHNLMFGSLFANEVSKNLSVVVYPGPKAVSICNDNRFYSNYMPAFLFGVSLLGYLKSFYSRFRTK